MLRSPLPKIRKANFSFSLLISFFCFFARFLSASKLNFDQKCMLSDVANTCILGTVADFQLALEENSCLIRCLFMNWNADAENYELADDIIKFALLQETSDYFEVLVNFIDASCALNSKIISKLVRNIKRHCDVDYHIFFEGIQIIVDKLDFNSKLNLIVFAVHEKLPNVLVVVDIVLLSLTTLEVNGAVEKEVIENQKNAITLLVRSLSCDCKSAELLDWANNQGIGKLASNDSKILIEQFETFMENWSTKSVKYLQPEDNPSIRDLIYQYSSRCDMSSPLYSSSLIRKFYPFYFILSTLPHFRNDPDLANRYANIDGDFTKAFRVAFFENQSHSQVLALSNIGNIFNSESNINMLVNLAINRSSPELLELLLDQNINVDICGLNENSALCLAIQRKDYEIIRLVLKYGASDEYAVSNGNWSKLLTAVAKDNIEEVERLLLEGAAVKTSPFSALNMAVHNNNLDVASLLLNHGASVLDIDIEGVAPLFLAIKLIRIELVELFLNQISDRNIFKVKDVYGWSLLTIAAKRCNFKSIRLLLDRGIKEILPDAEFIRALELAIDSSESSCTLQNRLETVRVILGSVVDLNMSEKLLLVDALKGKHYRMLSLLLKYGSDINKASSSGHTFLSTAIAEGNFKMTRFALQNGSNPNAYHPYRKNYLQKVLYCGYRDIFQLLLEFEADIDAVIDVNSGNTLLIDAAESKKSSDIQFLLENNANAEIKNNAGKTAMAIAGDKLDECSINVLIKYQKDTPETRTQNTALLGNAVRNGSWPSRLIVPDCFYKLINYGADPSGHLINLTKISSSRCSSIFQLLIEKGANVDECDDEGVSILEHMLKRRELKLTELLLDNKAKYDVEAFNEALPEIILEDHGHFELIKLLIKYGANINAKNSRGKTALTEAARTSMNVVSQSMFSLANYCTRKVQFLLDNGADINIFDGEKKTALFYAVDIKTLELVELLLDRGAKLNVEGSDYSFADYAVSDLKCTELLLKYVQNIDEPNVESRSALLNALYLNRPFEFIKLLLQKGSNPKIVDNQRNSALYYAQTYPYIDMRVLIIKLLLECGANPNVPGFNPHFLWEALDLCKYKEDLYAFFFKYLDLEYIIYINLVEIKANIIGYAIINENMKLLRFLLEKNVDCSSINADGESALDFAKEHNKMQSYNIIKAHLEQFNSK